MIARVFHRHSRWLQLADAYIDGELAPSEVARFEEHLAGCVRCQSAVEAARATKTLLASAPALNAPRPFALTPEMAVRPGPASAPARPVALRLAQAATAIAVVAFATILTIDLTGGGGSNGPQPLAASEQATNGKATTGLAPTVTASPATGSTPAASASPTAEPTRPLIAPPPTEGAGAQGFSPSASASPTPSPTAVPPATAEPSPTTSVPIAPHTGPGFGAQDTSGGQGTTVAHTAPRQASVTAGWYRPAEIALGAAALVAAASALILGIRRRRG